MSKDKICLFWARGCCARNHCPYAHSIDELSDTAKKNFKSKPCNLFNCPYEDVRGGYYCIDEHIVRQDSRDRERDRESSGYSTMFCPKWAVGKSCDKVCYGAHGLNQLSLLTKLNWKHYSCNRKKCIFKKKNIVAFCNFRHPEDPMTSSIPTEPLTTTDTTFDQDTPTKDDQHQENNKFTLEVDSKDDQHQENNKFTLEVDSKDDQHQENNNFNLEVNSNTSTKDDQHEVVDDLTLKNLQIKALKAKLCDANMKIEQMKKDLELELEEKNQEIHKFCQTAIECIKKAGAETEQAIKERDNYKNLFHHKQSECFLLSFKPVYLPPGPVCEDFIESPQQ